MAEQIDLRVRDGDQRMLGDYGDYEQLLVMTGLSQRFSVHQSQVGKHLNTATYTPPLGRLI